MAGDFSGAGDTQGLTQFRDVPTYFPREIPLPGLFAQQFQEKSWFFTVIPDYSINLKRDRVIYCFAAFADWSAIAWTVEDQKMAKKAFKVYPRGNFYYFQLLEEDGGR